MAMAAIVWLYCFFVFDSSRELFRDSDTGWHIRTGERIAATKMLPATDPYSFTARGRPWFAWEWLSDLAMGATNSKWGLGGVVVLFTAVIAGTVWLWLRATWSLGGDFLIAAAFLPLFLSASSLHWLARPHLFSWPLILGAAWAAERSRTTLNGKFLAACLAAGCLWANSHASFLLGFAVGLCYASGCAAGALLWPADARHLRAKARVILTASVTFLAGTLVNPYGWHLHAHVLRYLANTELLARIAEFQSFNFHADGAGQIVAVLAISFVGVSLAVAEKQLGRALLTLCLTILALRSARGIPIAALVCLPLANASFRSWWDRTRSRSGPAGIQPSRPIRWLESALQYSANLRTIDRAFAGWVWAPLLLGAACGIMSLPAMAASAGFSPKEFPVAVADKVTGLPPDARLLSTDKFGGYLIYRFNGQRPVFFDGRSDFYGVEFMKQYLKLIELRPGWEKVLEEYHPTHALLPSGAPLRHALQKEGWREICSDKVAFLLERPRI